MTELDRPGSGFLFDHAGGLALVTAAHLTSGAPEELVTFRQSWGEGEPITEYLDLVGIDPKADVAAYALPNHAWPNWFVGTVPVSSDKLVYGQDCYILGYPYGLATRVGDAGNELAIIRKGIVAGALNRDGQRGWYVDAMANPGFSGGPLVFERNGLQGQFAIAGMVRGMLMAPAEEPSDATPDPGRTPAGLAQCTDAKHILDLGLTNKP